MKNLPALFLLLLLILPGKGNAVRLINKNITVETPAEILKDNNSFYAFISENLYSLTRRYKSFDAAGNAISKLDFLHELTTGKYLFLQTGTEDKPQFKLYLLNKKMQATYGDVVSAYVAGMYQDYKWVGQKFPEFSFTDINGKHYSSASVKGKVMVLKCWYLQCGACRAEIPELNKMVAGYKNRSDVVFISLLTDDAAKTKAFMKDHTFNYGHVPGQSDFVAKKLNVTEFPTHFVVNKQGIIVNVVDNPQELEQSLKEDI
jgi:peroxiredoxin